MQKPISNRKERILALHLEGKSNKDIAAELNTSPMEVKFALRDLKQGRVDKKNNPFERIKVLEARIDALEKLIYDYFELRRQALERKLK